MAAGWAAYPLRILCAIHECAHTDGIIGYHNQHYEKDRPVFCFVIVFVSCAAVNIICGYEPIERPYCRHSILGHFDQLDAYGHH